MSAHTPGPQCSATVFSERVTNWQCFRKGKVQRDGKWYCAQHDPEAKARRQAATEKRWAEENKARNEKWAAHDEQIRRAACYPDLLAACEAAYAVLQAVEPDARGIAHTAATWTIRDAIATARKGDT